MTKRRVQNAKKRTVRYVDTSIVLNMLNVPGRNQDRDHVLRELAESQGDTFILPLSSIIETGNHIAHLADGFQRRQAAERFTELLKKIARGEFPWTMDKLSMDRKDLEFYASHFPDYAVRGVGMGDLSIIREFTRYVERIGPSVSGIVVKIWSLDAHLSGYVEEL
ncbi:hypothetical protein [Alicyclobacillus macrosporangiidus]|uniref:PIN domain-containing protein n=1 Tax=Alicyclobacillus macrosporangiidus TaxID=392015 RepID=A0A1I7GEF2_9BACL|nr:hypothetical protein [Alicyclobacillus macrosporangiidus]SFU46820.1 hypothetical protein SAMN05421543_102163 [Alicyclobacillus macrosporangiidus]